MIYIDINNGIELPEDSAIVYHVPSREDWVYLNKKYNLDNSGYNYKKNMWYWERYEESFCVKIYRYKEGYTFSYCSISWYVQHGWTVKEYARNGFEVELV